MSAGGICPGCGAALPRRGWEGLCPRCVAKVGLGPLLLTFEPIEGVASQPAAPPPPDLFPTGTRLGDYEILEEIARGGMGIVYRARQRSLNRIVAVKMILAGPNPKPEFLKRFRAEAEAAASLRHPNIVAIYNIADEGGHPFFSMEYVPGRNLSEMVEDGPLPLERAARYAQKVAAAIHFAHERGILHRDLKPSNILVDEFDEPRVTDFGLAKRLSAELDVTNTGQLLGSPQYLAPEQMSSRRGEVGPRADVYSLGAVLYHLVAGRPPFVAATMEGVLLEVIDVDPEPPLRARRHNGNNAAGNISAERSLRPGTKSQNEGLKTEQSRKPLSAARSGLGFRSSDLDVICLKCLEKDPDRRYGSAQEVAEELGRYLSGEPIHARPRGRVESIWRWTLKRRSLVAAVLMTIVALAAVLFALRKFKPTLQATVTQPIIAFSFGDNTFAESNWTLVVAPNGLATQTAMQSTQGYPGPSRQVITRVAAQSEAIGFHLHKGSVYVPGLRGPITKINVKVVASVQEGTDNPLLSVLVMQGGQRYLSPLRAIAYGGWTEAGALDLRAADFCAESEFERRANEHPDFSARGLPLQFGFAVSDSDPRNGHMSVLRLDNWTVQAHGLAPGGFPIADGEFAPADWSIYSDTGGTEASAAGLQLKSGGNPGACWQMTMILSNAAAMLVYCFHTGAIYDPAQQGALDAVDLFIDGRQSAEAFGQNLNPSIIPTIAQDGRLFLIPRYEALTHVRSAGGWLQLRFPGLQSGALQEMRAWHHQGGNEAGTYELDKQSHPDFSTNGAPLRFGFAVYRNAYYHSPDGQAFNAVTCFDNFRVAVQPLSGAGVTSTAR